MNPLPQYGAYAFIPYTTPSALTNTTSASISPPPVRPSFGTRHTSIYTYCGSLLSTETLPASLHPWLTQTTTSPSALLSQLLPLLSFLRAFLEKAGVHHYWLTLRASTPTKEFDIPRWHADDDFFRPASASILNDQNDKRKKRKDLKKGSKKGGWKLCTTLLGPSTLFLHPSSNDPALTTLRETKKRESAKREHICSSIRCAGCFDTGEAVRQSLATAFAEEEVMQAECGEIVFFRIGEEGAVHSEPRCGVDRVFVNVVPGTEGELRRLMGRYGMGFPRAWSLGVPGGLGPSNGFMDGMCEAEGNREWGREGQK